MNLTFNHSKCITFEKLTVSVSCEAHTHTHTTHKPLNIHIRFLDSFPIGRDRLRASARNLHEFCDIN